MPSSLVRAAQCEGGGWLQPEESSRRRAIAGEVVSHTPLQCPPLLHTRPACAPVAAQPPSCQQGQNKRELFPAWSPPPGSSGQGGARPSQAGSWLGSKDMVAPNKQEISFLLTCSVPASQKLWREASCSPGLTGHFPGSHFYERDQCLKAPIGNAHISGTGEGADILEASPPGRFAGNSMNILH